MATLIGHRVELDYFSRTGHPAPMISPPNMDVGGPMVDVPVAHDLKPTSTAYRSRINSGGRVRPRMNMHAQSNSLTYTTMIHEHHARHHEVAHSMPAQRSTPAISMPLSNDIRSGVSLVSEHESEDHQVYENELNLATAAMYDRVRSGGVNVPSPTDAEKEAQLSLEQRVRNELEHNSDPMFEMDEE